MSQTQCVVDIPAQENQGLTVGAVFYINCRSEESILQEFEFEKAVLSTEKKYEIHLLKAQPLTATEFRLIVTSYKVGDHQLSDLVLTEGEEKISLPPMSFQVKSVMNPLEPRAEPYGPQGAIHFSIPLLYWLILAALLISVGSFFFIRVRRRAQRKNLLKQLRIDQQSQEPLAQFYQSLRRLQRQEDEDMVRFVENLDKAFKIYIARIFHVPTIFWPDRKVVATIKKEYKKNYEDVGGDLKKTLSELSRATKAGNQLQPKDGQQLLELCRNTADLIDKKFSSESR